MTKIWQILVTFLATTVVRYDAYRILCVYPYHGRSHFILLRAVSMALANQGHQVDVISHYPLERPVKNYRDVVNLHGTQKQVSENVPIELALTLGKDLLPFIAHNWGNDLCDLLGHEKMRDFMANLSQMESYDAVIVEIIGCSCYMAFGHYFKAPVIGVLSTTQPAWTELPIKNPSSLASTPHLLYYDYVKEKFDKFNFRNRLVNTYSYYRTVQRFNYITEAQNAKIKKYFGSGVPDVRTLEANVALTLVNTHHSFSGVSPFVPSIVEIAGIHLIEDDTVITSDLEQWMDESKDGVVYFNLGSMMKLESLSPEKLRIFFRVFEKLKPIKILTKMKNPEAVKIPFPTNLKAVTWVPQTEVLRHNHTKLFITHGGIMSVIEATNFGVPMIGIPFYCDQRKNVNADAVRDYIIPIPYEKISKKVLRSAINEILENSKYKQAADRKSKIFQDRPLDASAMAVFWVEYVIRNGADSLKSPAIELYWWQNDLLDIYLFFMSTVILVLYLAFKLLTIVFRTKPYSDKKEQ